LRLFEPGRIGSLTTKNRIAMAPMFCMGMTDRSEQKGYSQRGIDYYAARAKGGTGLIITGVMVPSEKMEASWGFPVVSDASAGLWLNELAEAVHDYGTKVAVQFSAGFGRQGVPNPALLHGGLVAPSPIPAFRDPKLTCRELTIEEIEEFVSDFEYGAVIMMIATPIFLPVIKHLGFDPVWFGVLFIVNMQMGFLTPPYGFTLFYIKGVAPKGVTMGDIYRSIWPFVLLQAVGLAVVMIFPNLILLLPNLIFGK